MRTLNAMMVVAVMVLIAAPNRTEGRCSSTKTIRQVYVIRRSIKLFKWLINWCSIAHSGLILEMSDGKQCVLEYMEDGRSHLYDARPTSTRDCWFESCKKLRMKDDSGVTYDWTRQKYGTSTSKYRSAQISPQRAQQQMQTLMGSKYDLIKNNCHVGQERLRRKWGMTVTKPYVPNLKSICSCKLPSWLTGPLNGLIGVLVEEYCGKHSG